MHNNLLPIFYHKIGSKFTNIGTVITDNTIDMCDDVIFGLSYIVSTNEEYERRRYVIPDDALLDNNFDGSNIEEDHIYEMAKNELAFDCGILGKICYLTFKKEDYIDID